MRKLKIITPIIWIILVYSHTPLLAVTVIASWDLNTEPDVVGYKLYYGTSSGVYGQGIDCGKVVAKELELNPSYGTRFYFAVTCYDSSGNEGPFSDEATLFIPDAVRPGSPKNLKVKLKTPANITLDVRSRPRQEIEK
jgi:hypothetical protein